MPCLFRCGGPSWGEWRCTKPTLQNECAAEAKGGCIGSNICAIYSVDAKNVCGLTYRALTNTLLLVIIHFVLIIGVFNIGYLVFYAKLLCVATRTR